MKKIEDFMKDGTSGRKRTVFLGGTCAGSKWRDEFIRKCGPDADCFNPVVDDWNDEARKNEIRHREKDDVVLYALEDPRSAYSIAELIDDSNKRPERTVGLLLMKDDGSDRYRSMMQVMKMAARNGAEVFYDMDAAVNYVIR